MTETATSLVRRPVVNVPLGAFATVGPAPGRRAGGIHTLGSARRQQSVPMDV